MTTQFASETQAKAAYYQFSIEPDPGGYTVDYPPWNDLRDEDRQLWFRVATAAINGKVVEEL